MTHVWVQGEVVLETGNSRAGAEVEVANLRSAGNRDFLGNLRPQPKEP